MSSKEDEANPDKREEITVSQEMVSSPEPLNSANDDHQDNFFIVALGASAGGLETFEKFFKNTPPDSGLAFVVIVHLDPDHKTLLPELLARYTQMPVRLAEEGMRVEPDSIYVIPSNREMTIMDQQLHLDEHIQPRGMRHTIDHFMKALAADMRENAAGVILSGTGTDGTQGIKAIKIEGGLVFVQDVENAKYPGMPQSAAAAGVADIVLPVEKIPGKLIELTKQPILRRSSGEDPTVDINSHLRQIFQIVNKHTGHDFSAYKSSTLVRRIERRMAINNQEKTKDYIETLKENPEECKALFREILIGVTSFFRDPEAFEALKVEILPQLIAEKEDGDPIRIWLPGCATGEEAYSIAILFHEHLEENNYPIKVQVFATDLDVEAIAIARHGVYPEGIASDLTEKQLQKYFTKNNAHYEVSTLLREMIVFAPQNLVSDPPFSKLDLVVCRNLLIYINPDVQKRIIPLFHQVIKPNGFMFLGSSETVGNYTDLFKPLNKKWKIYKRLEGGRRFGIDLPISVKDYDAAKGNHPVQEDHVHPLNPGQLAERLLVQRYSPPCVVINEERHVLYYSTRTSRFLEPPLGEPTQELLKMVREELRPALRTAITKAFSSGEAFAYDKLKVNINDHEETLTLRVEPLKSPASARGLALVVFETEDQKPQYELTRKTHPVALPEGESEQIIAQLEEQLQVANDEIQLTVERLETSNEELKSSNEELMSMNEEFQSTNEELETSKEELQALNEELVTVNSELEGKVEELSSLNDDMQNLLNSSEIATVFLDKSLCVKRYTPKAEKLFNLIQSDIGRPLKHLSSEFNYSELKADVEKVLDELRPIEREFTTNDNRHYLSRILPYRTKDDRIDGVVVTCVDITERKSAEEFRAQLAAIVETSFDAIFSQTPDGKIKSWNDGAESIFGYSADEVVGHFPDFIDDDNDYKKILSIALQGQPVIKHELKVTRKDGMEIYLSLTSSPILDSNQKVASIATIARDVTSERVHKRTLEKLNEAVTAGNIGLWDWDLTTNKVQFSPEWKHQIGYKDHEIKDDFNEWESRVHPDDLKAAKDKVRESIDRCVDDHEMAFRFRHKNGSYLWILAHAKIICDQEGKPARMLGSHIDTTHLKEAEDRVRESEKTQKALLDHSPVCHKIIDLDLNLQYMNRNGFCMLKLDPGENVYGKPYPFDFFPETHKKDLIEGLEKVLKTGEVVLLEGKTRDFEGAEVWLSHNLIPVFADDGTLDFITIVSADVTQQKNAQDRLGRAAQLSALGEIAAGVAHEINNPINGVINYAQLLINKDPEDDFTKNVLEKITKESQRVAEIVENLLGIAHKGNEKKEFTTPGALFEDPLNLLSQLMKNERVKVKNQFRDGLPEIYCNKRQVEQVVLNLISNARHALNEKYPKEDKNKCIILDANPLEDLSQLQIVIQDMGPGIPEDKLERIFDPFFTTKKTGVGTGLGLSIAQDMIRQNSGDLTIESKFGEYTKVTLTLPTAEK